MIAVDTSIWIDHLRRSDAALVELLEVGQAAVHPFVVGEIASGILRNRRELLLSLQRLPGVAALPGDHVLDFVERHRLMGRGIGWVDAHLLAATAAAQLTIWTRDRRLALVASDLGLLSTAERPP